MSKPHVELGAIESKMRIRCGGVPSGNNFAVVMFQKNYIAFWISENQNSTEYGLGDFTRARRRSGAAEDAVELIMGDSARRGRFHGHRTATGDIVGQCFSRRRTKEFITFMDQVVKVYEDREIHVVLDNLSTHSGSDVEKWLTKHSNVTFHFTPTGSSWLNQVEIWFGIITKQPSGEEPSDQYVSSSTPSMITSQSVTTTRNHAPGPRQRTRSSPRVRLIHQDFKKLLDNNDNQR